MTDLSEELKQSTVIVHPERFAYLKADKPVLGDHFLVAQDADEVTIVTKEENVNSVDYAKDTKWFALLEVQPNTPFLAVGFIAKMTKAIADIGLNVLVVSTYSKDYLLVRFEKRDEAIDALENLGLKIIKKQ